MPVMHEGKWTGEFVLSEASRMRARDNAIIARSTVLEPCTVLGRVMATGKYKQLDLSKNDGTEKAAGILYAGVDATDTDADCVVLARACEVKGPELIWADGITPEQRTAQESELAKLGIVVR